jgi:hypothetical protein
MEDVNVIYGGERGIRTPGTTFGSTRDFQSRSFNQLGHLSVIPKKRNIFGLSLLAYSIICNILEIRICSRM